MPLVSEAVRGEGAKLLNINKERFMEKYHPKAELARGMLLRVLFLARWKNINQKRIS